MNIEKNKSISSIKFEDYPDTHHDVYSKTVFGFWLYLLTDFVLFGVFFACCAVFSKSTFGGPSPSDFFHLPYVLIQTLLLLTSSFTIGIGSVYAHLKNRKKTVYYFLATFILGIAFMVMQGHEFSSIIHKGYNWASNAYLSSYFTLLGMHFLHVLIGALWILVTLFPLYDKGLDEVAIKRLTCMKMFWQFVNIIWIFIFSFIYLIGAHTC